MADDHHTTTIYTIEPSTSDKHEVELDDIGMSNVNDSAESNTNSSPRKCNFITRHFQKIVRKFDYLNVEKRGIERISAEDRNDSTIINTAMIWVR
jgi:hypothetical protein